MRKETTIKPGTVVKHSYPVTERLRQATMSGGSPAEISRARQWYEDKVRERGTVISTRKGKTGAEIVTVKWDNGTVSESFAYRVTEA